jgi:hypothetical protein
MNAAPRSRGRALARFLTLVGLLAALAAITAGTASAWGSQGFNFGSPSGLNGWYTHSPVNGQVFFDVDGSPFDPDSGDYSEKLTGITCGGTGVTGGLFGTFFSNVSTSVSVTGETGPGGVAVVCNATYERGTYSLCSIFGCAFSGYTPYSTAQAGRTINIDLSPPVGVTVSHAPANANGWHNTPSSVTFGGAGDPNSGIAFCRSGAPFGPGGPGQSIGPPDGFRSIAGGCQNVAGLNATTGMSYAYDATNPTLAPTVSPNPVLRGAAATASPHATDNLSGIAAGDASCDPVDTSAVGSHTVSCTATDRAGNSNSASAGYDVVLGFTGFASPVDNDIVNVAKAGQIVPLKFHVSDANGPVTDLSSASVTVTVSGVACDLGSTSDQIEEYASGNSGLQNLGGGDYQFNWQTPKSYASSCKLLSVDIGDGMDHTTNFRFTK